MNASSETSNQNIGYTWCDRCETYVPDVFTDHAQRHAQEDLAIPTIRSEVIFWAFCLASGVIAALAVLGTM